MMMPDGMVLGLLLARQHREIGQFGQRDVHPEGARAGLEAIHAAREFGGQVGAIDQLAKEQAGPTLATTITAAISSPLSSRTPDRPCRHRPARARPALPG